MKIRLVRLLAFVIALVVSWFVAPSAGVVATAPAEAVSTTSYVYDGRHTCAESTGAPERGPPGGCYDYTDNMTLNAVDRGVKPDGTIMNGHHRIAEMTRRVNEGLIPRGTTVRIDTYQPGMPTSGYRG
jgi:hypothetical protein